LFDATLEVAHGVVDDRGTCAVGDFVPSAENPRRPCVVTLERRRGRERDQRVHERKLVVQLANVGEGFAHQRNCLVGVAAPHCKDGANRQHQ
jgi:hypothetical protein